MTALRTTRPGLRHPTESESRMARESSRRLGSVVADLNEPKTIEGEDSGAQVVVRVNGHPSGETLTIPLAALKLLRLILEEMANGNAITLTPVHAELTTQEAADLLCVSRPFLTKLVDDRTIPHRKVGRHRRIRFDDLMAFKEKTDAQRSEVLKELVAEAQELNMGY